MIDLDTLEQLLNDVATAEGVSDADYVSVCDPATVAALTRAVQAALRLATVHPLDAGQAERDLNAALAPFRTTAESAR